MAESKYLKMIMESEDGFKVSTNWMEKKFTQFNEMYFNNKLKKPKFLLSRTKSSHGLCIASFNKMTFNTSYEIKLSTYYNKMSEHEYENVLVHEMIHEYTYEKYGFYKVIEEAKKYGKHGPIFTDKMDEINKIGKHQIVITGVANEHGTYSDSDDLRDYSKEMKENKFFIITQENKLYGVIVSNKMEKKILQRLLKWNVFICKINDPMFFKIFIRIFKSNQNTVASIMNKERGCDPVQCLNSHRLQVEDVYIRDNFKLMNKPTVFTMDYLMNPLSYIDNGENRNNKDVEDMKEEIRESIERRKKKFVDDIEIKDLKKIFDYVEEDGNNIIVGME